MAFKFGNRPTRRLGATIGGVAVVAMVAVGGTAAAISITSSGPATTGTVSKTTPAAGSSAPLEGSTPTSAAPTSAAPANPAPSSPTPTTAVPMTAAPTSGAVGIGQSGESELISDTCLYSHEANDDPILMPGLTGQSMAHDFFGNTTTSATSTASTLVGGPTTCSTSDDASAYWTPVLYQFGREITPIRNLIYWAGLHATDPTVSAPPAGLEMIAGDETATEPQSLKVIDWRCADAMPQPLSNTPVNCAGTEGIELRVTFPSCWDGTTLNGASETNVVYPEANTSCPPGYPVRIPTVIFHVVYPITSAAGLTLSMGPNQQGSTDTAHGDFINGWNESVITALIDGCAGPANNCGHVTGANAVVHQRRI
jgi:hypothetical protein